MRFSLSTIVSGVLSCALPITLVSCKTDDAGVKSTYRSQWTTVAGNTVDATEAAKDVLEDLKLQRIASSSTGLDGYASGYTADNKKINVDVKKLNDETSEVSVNVGTVGDPGMGKDIIARIQRELND